MACGVSTPYTTNSLHVKAPSHTYGIVSHDTLASPFPIRLLSMAFLLERVINSSLVGVF